MPLSAPIYLLKRTAKRRARTNGTALHQALDAIAKEEGFRSWSHLVATRQDDSPAQRVLSKLAPGDLVLIAARPGHGKTLLGLELAAKAARTAGPRRKSYVFSLEDLERDMAERLCALGIDPAILGTAVVADTSDDICAAYILRRLHGETPPALIVIDYLQLLDQKRSNPGLDAQITALKAYTKKTGAICVLLSQIDRSFELAGKDVPDMSDIRLPNQVDLSAFDTLFFLHEGQIHCNRAAFDR